MSVAKVSEVVQSRYTILEHLVRKSKNKLSEGKTTVADDYLNQDSEIRLLAYKLMIDKFNEKYVDLSIKQKSILKEYINNISNTTALKDFVLLEGKSLNASIKKTLPKIKDKVTTIKLNEVCNMLVKLEKVKTIKEDHVLSLLLYHELLKELKNVK